MDSLSTKPLSPKKKFLDEEDEKIDFINSKEEELVDYFNFEQGVTNWNDFCQV